MDKRQVLSIIGIVITVLLAGALAIFLWMEKQENKQREAAYEAMEKELRPLELQKYELRQELDTLNAEYDRDARGTASVVFLFTDMDELIYTEIYPQLESYGFKGVLLLSEEKSPGQEGCMSQEHFSELMEAGWECCLRWDEDMSDREWREACGRLILAGIARPQAVYFPADTYDNEIDDVLIRRGMSMAIHHGEKDMSLILSETDEQVWHPGAMPWNHSRASVMLSEAMSRRGNLIFTIGSDSPEEVYESEACASMLQQIQRNCESGDLMVTDLAGAREYREKIEEERGNLDDDYNNQKSELEAQIEELDLKMDEITDKYRKN